MWVRRVRGVGPSADLPHTFFSVAATLMHGARTGRQIEPGVGRVTTQGSGPAWSGRTAEQAPGQGSTRLWESEERENAGKGGGGGRRVGSHRKSVASFSGAAEIDALASFVLAGGGGMRMDETPPPGLSARRGFSNPTFGTSRAQPCHPLTFFSSFIFPTSSSPQVPTPTGNIRVLGNPPPPRTPPGESLALYPARYRAPEDAGGAGGPRRGPLPSHGPAKPGPLPSSACIPPHDASLGASHRMGNEASRRGERGVGSGLSPFLEDEAAAAQRDGWPFFLFSLLL